MATPSPWKGIEYKFCRCSICLDQLQEQKLLPCLHRYCKDCLSSIIQESYDVIKCHECREEIQIPTNGVDGFKTDFYSKSLVEFVQIQQSLKSGEIRECYSCSKHLRVAAYCFKCKDFLCKDCHTFHVTNKTLNDHQKHILPLEDIEAKNITIEKLASMRDAPRCHIHLEEISTLYCETCGNLPICLACTRGEHKGHNLFEVKTLAKLKREELTRKLKNLEKHEKGHALSTLSQAKEKLILNVSIEKEKVIKTYEEEDQKIMTKIQDKEARKQMVKQEKQNEIKKLFDFLQTEKELELERVKKKYGQIFEVEKHQINYTYHARESSLEKELAKFCETREHFNREKKQMLESIEKKLKENEKSLKTIYEYSRNIKKRFDTLNVMASGILVSDNDWSAVQCIPDMCTAATNLMKDLKKAFPELATLTDVTVNYKQSSFGKRSITNISDRVSEQITINNSYRHVYGMASSGDNSIVISGITSNEKSSFIIVIDMVGRLLKKKKLNTGKNSYPRYCKFLSQNKVASACQPNEIGLYDVRKGSYINKNISDVIISWPKDRFVSCVATDPVNNHILVGGYNSRDVYVFDDQLKYLRILTLPEIIKWPRDIIVSDGHLLVCDYGWEKCYVTATDGLESKLVGEFMKPDLDRNDGAPISVCTDSNGFFYILWKTYKVSRGCVLAQYDQGNNQVLTTREVDEKATLVTVVETPQGEKLLVATFSSQTMDVYDLITKE